MKRDWITVITPYYPTESSPHAGIFVFDQAKSLISAGNSVYVVVPKPLFRLSRKWPFISSLKSDAIVKKDKNIQVNTVRYVPFPKDSVLYNLSIKLSLWSIRGAFSDLVIAHTIYPIGAALSFYRSKITVVVHGSDLRYFSQNSQQRKLILKVASKHNVVCVSEGLKIDLERYLTEADVECKYPISVIHNGIEPIAKISLKREKGGAFRFVFVGALIKQKGIYELLKSFIKLSEHVDCIGKCELLIIGDGPEMANIEKRYSSISNISLLGNLPNCKVIKQMSQSDCLVLPSHKEGFGRVIIEMLHLGKPVISTKSGGPEYIINDDVGLTVTPKSESQLFKAMKSIVVNYDGYNPEAIKQYAVENFDLSKQTIKLLNIARSIADD